MLYRLNLILNFNQGLALFGQNQILCPNRHRNLQNHNNEGFFYSTAQRLAAFHQ